MFKVSGAWQEFTARKKYYVQYWADQSSQGRIKNLLHRHDEPNKPSQPRKDPLNLYSISPHLPQFQPQSKYWGRVEIGGMCLPTQLERHYNVMVDIVKRGGRAAPSNTSQGWADFSIMKECTLKSGHCESSVYNVLSFNHIPLAPASCA